MIEKRMELTDGVWELFLEYKKKNGFGHDSGALYHLMICMVSQATVFSLVYDAAECFVPIDELSEEQLEKLDNITLHPCNCRDCRKTQMLAHADRTRLELGWSKPYFSTLLSQKMSMKATLIQAIDTILHEIIHILFPDYDEEQVRKKTIEWLKRPIWLKTAEKMECLSKSDLRELGYNT